MPPVLAVARDASFPVLAFALVLWAAVAAIKAWPSLRELQIKGDASMRSELMTRISTLEGRVKELEKLVSQQQAEHSLREQFLRHELANEAGVLDAALAMLQINPDRVVEIIEQVVSMREAGRQRISLEKGAAAGAAVAAAGRSVTVNPPGSPVKSIARKARR